MANGHFKKNGVAPKENITGEEPKGENIFKRKFSKFLTYFTEDKHEDGEAPKTWKERLTYVAENAKNDKEAPSYLKGHIRAYLVFNTESDGFYWWLMIVNFAVLYNLIFVIGRSCFWNMENLMPVGWLGKLISLKSETKQYFPVLDYFCDCIYLVDIFVRIHEGYLEQGLLVKDVKLLRKNYLNGSSKIVDFLSIFPTDFAYFMLSSTCHEQIPCPVVVRLNRIFRIYRMFEFFDKTETRTSFPNAFRISKIILNLLILIHWDACFYFVVSFYVGFETDVWVYHG